MLVKHLKGEYVVAYVNYNKCRKIKGKLMNKDDNNFEDKIALRIKAFEETYEFDIWGKCSPSVLPEKEHLWIQRLKSLYPLGLSLNNPLGFPLLL